MSGFPIEAIFDDVLPEALHFFAGGGVAQLSVTEPGPLESFQIIEFTCTSDRVIIKNRSNWTSKTGVKCYFPFASLPS